jgi:hypothetical protein
MELKLRILNEFGMPLFLAKPDDIEVYFPFENDGPLVKRMSYGTVEVLDDSKGEIKVKLSSFDVQGLPVGDGQSFSVKIINGSKVREAMFPKTLNVRTMIVDGQNRKVIAKL